MSTSKSNKRSSTQLAASTQFITALALQHGAALPQVLMDRLSITRRAALALLRRLVEAHWLVKSGSPKQPLWAPGSLRQVVMTYPLQGLAEDMPWARDFAACFNLPPNVARLVQHAFSELLNNAIDHSGGSAVTVSVRQTAMHVQLLVSDDGCGVFNRIAQAFDIPDATLAMFELSKGKLTSMPQAHSGHGLFFTARLADFFNLHANENAFQLRNSDLPTWVKSRPMPRQGTSVYLAIALDTPRCLDEVLVAHSLHGQGLSDSSRYSFDRTVLPLRLLTGHNIGLESRAQARRVMARMSQFRRAEVDFGGIEDIGHAFADEMFRVQRAQAAALDLQPVRMSPRVAAMVKAVSV
jgi:anti-sigma regulatory factor (Ser/Thr protein kinase)